MLIIIFAILSVVAELIIHINQTTWTFRPLFSAIALWFLGISLGMVLLSQQFIVAFVFAAIGVLRAFNLMRINRNQADAHYYRRASRRSSLSLIFIGLLGIALALGATHIEAYAMWTLLACVQFIAASLVLAFITHNLLKTSHEHPRRHYADSELPSVTIAIPARNETAGLASCLTSLINNSYPKFEIIVLDDCSQDNTPLIIKEFAHDGVRFIKGQPPKKGWLAKNQAYQQLYEEASGEIIIFCGVDTRFEKDALRHLVTALMDKNRSMISLLPLRSGGGIQTALVQPMRYWWEMALPRRLFNRPPVLSTCWAIEKLSLKKLGGFAAVSNSIVPEGYFARELISSDQYAFIRASEYIRVLTVKSVEEQFETALRMRYPQLRKRIENAGLIIALEALLLIGPFVLLSSVLWNPAAAYQAIAALAAATLVLAHYKIAKATNIGKPYIAIINFPLVAATEVLITILSAYKYEFSRVEWKGRNICIPAMRVVPRLPAIRGN